MAHITDITRVSIDIEPTDPSATSVDPVCGKKIERRASRFMVFRGGDTFYFCCRECKDKFAP